VRYAYYITFCTVQAAFPEIAMIKAAVPAAVCDIVDRAIQVCLKDYFKDTSCYHQGKYSYPAALNFFWFFHLQQFFYVYGRTL
jgi:hypothetical protein